VSIVSLAVHSQQGEWEYSYGWHGWTKLKKVKKHCFRPSTLFRCFELLRAI